MMNLSERINDTNAAPWVIEEIKRLEAERNALAAHVERLHMAWVDAKRCVSVVAFPALYRVEQYQHLAKRSIEKLESVVSDTPTTSLARLKAQWQEEALSAMIAAIPFSEALARGMLKHRRDEHRCQAEEGEG